MGYRLLARLAASFDLRPPRIPFVSNLTGTWITPAQATDPGYWAEHLCRPVRFHDGLETLWRRDACVLLEVGPGQSLATLARQHPQADAGRPAIATMRHAWDPQPDAAVFLGALGRLWLEGVEVDWRGVHRGEHRRRLSLPGYPFERRRCWLEAPGRQTALALPASLPHPTPTTPAPTTARPGLRNAWVAPAGRFETRLAEIWGELLGITGIGSRDNFFELGGHSLLGAKLVNRLRESFGVPLRLRHLFETPTLAGLAGTLEGLVRGQAAEHAGAIPRRPEGEPPVLSFAQERLWFLERLGPGTAVWNVPAALALDGELDRAALAKSLAEIVRRHEALRLRLHERDGRPAASFEPPYALPLPLIDLAGCPAEHTHALLRAEARRPFVLAGGRLVRALLVRLGRREHALLLVLHHAVCDAFSLSVLQRELGTLYQAFAAGRPSPLAELPIQIADFARWQRRELVGEKLDELLAFWRRRLAGSPAVLELPTDHPRPAVPSRRGGEHRFVLRAELVEPLRRQAAAAGASLFMTLFSGFAALLARWSGQRDLVIGSAVANRERRELEGLAGFLVNNLVLRLELGGDPRWDELLERARQVALDAYAHQELPFDKLVEELHPERHLSHNPLFQVAFQLLSEPAPSRQLGGLGLRELNVSHGAAQFDLTLHALETQGRAEIGAWLELARDLFDVTTIARLAGHWQVLLEAVAAAPALRLSELPLLRRAERWHLLGEWSDTAVAPAETTLDALFEAQAERDPAALALVFAPPGEPRQELGYGELARRAHRLAHQLRRLGVGRGSHVGILVERSPEQVVAVLGVLLSGAAYVPLDRRWPAERLRHVLGALAARCVLTSASRLGVLQRLWWRLPALGDLVVLDSETPTPPPEPVERAAVRGLWDHVAERASDWIGAGGFVHENGEPFSAEEVLEYRDRVLALAEPWLEPSARVLEIGCGSGLILEAMAPRVAHVVGLDPSPATLQALAARLDRAWLDKVELSCGFADEIARLEPASFDLVVLASTVHFFPGPRYLEQVLARALARLEPGGALLLADVPDARRSPEGTALALDEAFFADFAAAHPEAGEVEIHHRHRGFANELGRRYDVIVRKVATPHPPRVRTKRLWTGWHLAEQPETRPVALTSPDDLAYVIFTSGSTGLPKGVAVRHRAAVGLVRWVNTRFDVGPGDRLLFVTSLGFDLSVYDLLGTLAAGATVHLAAESETEDPLRLAELLVREPITFWDTAPAALQQLVPLFAGLGGERERLRRVFLSGDWIPVTLPDQVRAAFPRAQIVSLGGATEATVWSNVFAVGAVDPSWPSIPYGRPISGARYCVLDPRFEPCPVGVAGDLWIGGECLALGYAADPAQTADRFVPDPWGFAPGARLYRTGDRARFRPGGVMEFLGRSDDQVKLRGFRIELGEIASVLGRLDGVDQCAVRVHGETERRRLVAWVVPSEGAERTRLAELLAQQLKDRLPDYMVPTAFVLLDALPTTANGKLDRDALPAPEYTDEQEHVAPRTETERALATIWQEVLGLESVGVHDNFFRLGGDSILSVQIIARANRAGLRLAPRDLFRHQTIAELARLAETAAAPGEAQSQELLPAGLDLETLRELAGTGEIVDAYPLSPFQQLMLERYLKGDESGLFLINLDFVIRDRKLDRELFERAWQKVIDRHPVLRSSFFWRGLAEPLQLVHAHAQVPIVVEDWRAEDAAEQAARFQRFFDEQCRRGLPLETAPHTRLALVRTGEQETVFIWTINLMLQDGWSFPVILSDFFACYEALEKGSEPALPAPTPYRDYVALTKRLDLAAAETFWRRELAGFTRPTPLLASLGQKGFAKGAVAKQGTALALATKAALAEITKEHQLTLYTLAAAAWALVLHRLTGDTDVVFGIWVSTRPAELPGVETMVGNFLNFLPLRVQIEPERELLPWLETIQARLLELRRFELTPPLLIEKWSEIPAGTPLYESYLVFESFPIAASLRERAERWDMAFVYRDVGRTGVPLRVEVHPTEGLLVLMQAYRGALGAETVDGLIASFRALLEAMAESTERTVRELAERPG